MEKQKSFFEEQAEFFQDELRENALQKLRENDPEYRKLVADNANSSKEVDEILHTTFGEEHPVTRYVKQLQCISSIERNYLYQQGYRDCMNYLKHIGTFNC